MKYLLLAVVAYLLWAAWRRRQARHEREPLPPARQELVRQTHRCPVCGVYFPEGDGVVAADGRQFCSSDHRDRGAA